MNTTSKSGSQPLSAPEQSYPQFPHPGEEFLTPAEWLATIDPFMREFNRQAPNHPAARFRGRPNKPVHEAWQAAIFGYAYGCAHHLGTLQIRHNCKLDSESDATFRWIVDGRNIVMPVQLKEVPPREVNALETIEGILEKIATKYPTLHDLTVAIHSNRTEAHSRELFVTTPVGQLWIWGWSKPDFSEIFLIGGGAKLQRAFRVPFRRSGETANVKVIDVTHTPR